MPPAPECIVRQAGDRDEMIVSIVRPAAGRPSEAVGSMLRRQGSFCVYFFLSSFAPLLRPWKAVQLPRHSVSAAVSRGPRLKTPKGPPGKVARPYLSGLMSKMLQSAGNLLQSGTRSLLLQRAAQKKKKKKEGGRGRQKEKREREK